MNTNSGPSGTHAGVRYDYTPANTPSVLSATDSRRTDDDTVYLYETYACLHLTQSNDCL